MRSLSLLVGLLLLSCSVIAAAEVWEPCANASTLTLSNGYSRLEANGYNARVATVASNGTVLPVYISLEIQAIQEWLVDSPQRECLFIGSPYAPGTRLSYLTAYRSLLMDDFQCKSDLLNLTLPNGVAAEQISIVMRHEVFSNFTFTFNWTRSHGEYEETYPGSANSAFKSVVHRYKSDAFKLTMGVENFPYSSPDPARTYLELDMQLGGLVDREGRYVFHRIADDIALMQYNSSDGVYQIKNEVDTGFLLDGVTYINQLDLGSVDLESLPISEVFYFPFSFTFCNVTPPGTFIEKVIWDPQLSVLFDPIFEPASPPTKTKTALLALYIVLPIVAILVVGGIIAFVLLKPRITGKDPNRFPHRPVDH